MSNGGQISDSTFTVASDEYLSRLIGQARDRILFVSPGINEAVAEALARRLQDSQLTITVILDSDPEVYRLGFGTPEGLSVLKASFEQSHLAVRCQPGVRIGILVVDDKTLIYSPSPALIEAGSTIATKPNALFLEGATATKLSEAAGASDNTTPATGEIGKQALTPADVDAIKKNIEENPPEPFDLTQKARVFSSRLQYVEFSIEKYQLTNKTVSIPAYLMGLEGDKVDRWHNNLRVLDKEATTVSIDIAMQSGGEKPTNVDQRYLEAERKKIEKKYLIPILGFGNVMFKSQQIEFEADTKALQNLLDAYYSKLEKRLNDSMESLVDSVVIQLLPSVIANPPKQYFRHGKPSDSDVATFLKSDIRAAISLKKLLDKPRVKKVYKDIAYQSVKSLEFRGRLRLALEKARVPSSKIDEIFGEAVAVLQKGGQLFS